MRIRLVIALSACALLGAHTGVAQAATRPDPVGATLTKLAGTSVYTPQEIAAWRADWRAARSAARRLSGPARTNMAAVVASTRSLAGRKLLAGRARPAFLTLRNNLAWFAEAGRAAPANGARDGFGSEVVWQFYAGEGWQLQPLGTFGKLNGLLQGRRTDRIRALADQMLALGVDRKGYLAFEYLFPWSGGRAGWVSGMAQATGMQALAGAAARLGDARLMQAANRMVGAFLVPPPWGVRVDTAPGRAQFLLYSQDPELLVGNGFAQALLGLDRYRELSGDPRAVQLVGEGLAEARAAFPAYDTGAWSLYSRSPTGAGNESDLHYHRLFADFLGTMCTRFADPTFCTLKGHFDLYETQPVAITDVQARNTRGRRLTVSLTVSKRGAVKVSVWTPDRMIRVASRQLLRGGERFTFSRPDTRRPLRIKVEATSLTGVRSQAEAATG